MWGQRMAKLHITMMIPKTQFVIPANFSNISHLPPDVWSICWPKSLVATMPGSDAQELVILQRSWIPLTRGAAWGARRDPWDLPLGWAPPDCPWEPGIRPSGPEDVHVSSGSSVHILSRPEWTGTAGGTMTAMTTTLLYSISTSKLLVSSRWYLSVSQGFSGGFKVFHVFLCFSMSPELTRWTHPQNMARLCCRFPPKTGFRHPTSAAVKARSILGELWFQHVSTVHFPVSPVLFIKFVATKIQLASMKSTFLVG